MTLLITLFGTSIWGHTITLCPSLCFTEETTIPVCNKDLLLCHLPFGRIYSWFVSRTRKRNVASFQFATILKPAIHLETSLKPSFQFATKIYSSAICNSEKFIPEL